MLAARRIPRLISSKKGNRKKRNNGISHEMHQLIVGRHLLEMQAVQRGGGKQRAPYHRSHGHCPKDKYSGQIWQVAAQWQQLVLSLPEQINTLSACQRH